MWGRGEVGMKREGIKEKGRPKRFHSGLGGKKEKSLNI